MNPTCLLLLLVSQICLSQSTNTRIRGTITEQSSGNKPLQQVQVKAEFANATVTDNGGGFLLQFYKVLPGYDVAIVVDYPNWVVVNEDALIARIPDNADKQLLKIYMCPAERLAQSKIAFYQISQKNIEATFASKNAALSKQNADYEMKVNKLEAERDAAIRQLNVLSDEFARLNLDEVSTVQRKSIEQFEQGKSQSAISTLEGVNSTEAIAKAKKEKQDWIAKGDSTNPAVAKADSIINQQIDKLMFQSDLYALNLDFEKAEEGYKAGAMADTTQYENLKKCGNFFLQQNKFDKANKWYNMMLRNSKTDYGRANAFLLLGSANLKSNDFTNAESNLKQALNLFTRFAKINPPVYDFAVVDVLNDLGSTYFHSHRYKEAETSYLSALKILGKYDQSNAPHTSVRSAMIMGNIANVYKETYDFDAAEEYYKAALNIIVSLPDEERKMQNPFYAVLLSNLGNVYSATGKLEAAKSMHIKALRIEEQLVIENPDAYNPDLAIRLMNLSTVYSDEMDFDSALIFLHRAIIIQDKLAKSDPDAFNPLLAMMYGNLGNIEMGYGDFNAALQDFERAIALQEFVVSFKPEANEPLLAILISRAGNAKRELGNFAGSEADYKRAIEIQKALVKREMNRFSADLGSSYTGLALLCKSKLEVSYSDELRKAGSQYVAEALKVLNSSPPIKSVQMDLGICENLKIYFKSALKSSILEYNSILRMNKAVPELSSASEQLRMQQKVVIGYEKLIADPIPVVSSQQLNNSYGNLSWYLILNGQFTEAELYARKGLKDGSATWINTNLALSILLQERYTDAELIYKQYADQRLDSKRTFREAFLADLDEVQRSGINTAGMQKIRKMLQGK